MGKVFYGLTPEELCDLMCGEEEEVYECFHCCTRGVIWDADFTFEDFGYEGDGIVQICHCVNCGAEIEYRIAIGGEEDESGQP